MWRKKGILRPDIKKIIRGIMKEEGVTQIDLSKIFEFKYPSNFSTYFNKDWDLNEFILLMHTLNCELVIRHRNPNSNTSTEHIL